MKDKRQAEIDKALKILNDTHFHIWNPNLAVALVDGKFRSKDGFIIDNYGFPTEGHIKARDYKE